MATWLIDPVQWVNTKIVRPVNPLTNLIEGDDKGYRKVRTRRENPSPLIIPNVLVRASYDGVREDGVIDKGIALPGGLDCGALVVREAFAKDIVSGDQLLMMVFGGAYRLCALDGFRSWRRQAAGFTRMLRLHMSRMGLTDNNAMNDDRIVDFIKAGMAADGTFAWVNADVTSAAYATVADELRRHGTFMEEIDRAIREIPALENSVDEALYTFITISANAEIGYAAQRGIPLVYECNAHAGGGACDIFLVDAKGMPVNHVPFDYPGEEAGMDYLEQDEHFDAYRAKAATDDLLRNHLGLLGLTPETFEWKHWEAFRAGVRVLYHLAKAKKWTYYSSDHGGENWHLEGTNTGVDPLTGDVVFTEQETGFFNPDSGNPGHELQVHGPNGEAVWGGYSAHKSLNVL